MAIFVPRFVRQLRDVLIASPADGEVLTYDSADAKWKNEAAAAGGATGAAGGVLGGTYPNPGFAVDMATQAELDAHVTDITDAHDATAISFAPAGTIAATNVQAAIEEAVTEAVADLGPAVILAPASSARNVIQPTAGAVIAAIVKAHAAQSVDLTQWQKSDGTVYSQIDKFGALYLRPDSTVQLATGDFTRAAANLVGVKGTYGTDPFYWGSFLRVPHAVDGTWAGGGNEGGVSVYQYVADFTAYGYGFVSSLDLYNRDSATGAVNGYMQLSSRGMILTDGDLAGAGSTYNVQFGFEGDVVFSGVAAGILGFSDAISTIPVYAIRGDGMILTAKTVAPTDGSLSNGMAGWWWDQANSLPKWKGKTSGGVVVNFTPGDAALLADHSARHEDGGADEISLTGLSGAPADTVNKSLFDANTVLSADSDNTPAALTMGASTILARLAAGNIKAATPAETKTLLAVTLDDLSDVVVTTAANYEGLTNYGAGWVNGIRREARCPGLYETVPRWAGTLNAAAIVSQRLSLYSIELPRGITITSITFVSATTALGTGVNQLFGLFDDAAGASSGTPWALLRGSVDDTNTAWAANTAKTLALTSTYVTTRTGLFYVGILVNATTVPSLVCVPAMVSTGITGLTPKLGGLSTQTITALPNPAAAPTNQASLVYAYVS